MIRASELTDLPAIFAIINNSAQAYKGVIPADRWREPYMTWEELMAQISEGVKFWCYVGDGMITGVMGIQEKKDVTLIRHAYVRTQHRNKGVGSKLLTYLCQMATTPILIGTWTDAFWAVQFYQNHGFRLVVGPEKDALLRTYWNIPDRQVETSVVLTNQP